MEWSRIFLLGLFSTYLAGFTGHCIIRVFERFVRKSNPYFLRTQQQIVVSLFIFPIVLFIFCFQRMDFYPGGMNTIGCFLTDSHPIDDLLCRITLVVWGIGFTKKSFEILRSSCRLHGILKDNQPVSSTKMLNVLNETFLEMKFYRRLRLMKNGTLPVPISIGFLQSTIVLPDIDYSEKALRIVLEHELCHFRNGDLFWRKFAMVASLIHWYDFFLDRLVDRIIYTQEVICDVESSNNIYYSQKDYILCLLSFCDDSFQKRQGTAFVDSESMVVRRIEEMVRNGKVEKPKKRISVGSAFGILLVSLLFSNTLSAKAVELEENRIYACEVAVQYRDQKLENSGEVFIENAGNDVKEVILTPEILPYSQGVSLDKKIDPHTRVLYLYKQMETGNRIDISALSSDQSVSYKAGVKNRETGEVSYVVSENGSVSFSYTIPRNGSYSVYIENNNSFPIEIMGFANYQD